MSAEMSVQTAAKHLCERSDWVLSNLELQKMLYLAHMQYLGKTGIRLVDETFEAWDYGPVSPQVYWKVRDFGSAPVRNVFHGAPALAEGRLSHYLNSVYDTLSKNTAGQLVAITHTKDGAWAKNYRPGVRGIPIPDVDIIDEYKKRSER